MNTWADSGTGPALDAVEYALPTIPLDSLHGLVNFFLINNHIGLLKQSALLFAQRSDLLHNRAGQSPQTDRMKCKLRIPCRRKSQ